MHILRRITDTFWVTFSEISETQILRFFSHFSETKKKSDVVESKDIKGRVKVNGYQQIAAMPAIAHEGLSSAISNSHNNDQFH